MEKLVEKGKHNSLQSLIEDFKKFKNFKSDVIKKKIQREKQKFENSQKWIC